MLLGQNSIWRGLNFVMLAIMSITVILLATQGLCLLAYLVRWNCCCCKALHGNNYQDAKVIVLVPCYNEGETELRKTIKSARSDKYPNDKKVLIFVADGNVLGKNDLGNNNKYATPVILSHLLGYTKDDSYNVYRCGSTGFAIMNTRKNPIGNLAKLYHGTLSTSNNGNLKYMVIEKCGLSNNSDTENRGK